MQTTLFGKTVEEFEREKRLKEEEEKYPIEYILNYAKERASEILDIRYWENGITKEEFMRKYENDFRDKNHFSGFAVNSGHFCFLIPIYKRLGGDPEKLWKVLEERIVYALKEQIAIWKKERERSLRNSKRYEELGDFKEARIWKKIAEKELETIKLCEKELEKHIQFK